LFGHQLPVDVRLAGGVIAAVGTALDSDTAEEIIDAGGATLLPGLHDHHIHLMAFAASLDSLHCGPPGTSSESQLASLLRESNASGNPGWVRGIGYHPCVAGDIDRDWLDRHIPDRPVRIQHRGGRLWVLNSRGLRELRAEDCADAPPGLERVDGRFSGRLYECDAWLRSRLPSRMPDLAAASERLAGYGITGLTDTTPGNGRDEWAHFAASQARGELRQRVRMMGSRAIESCRETDELRRGEFKIHLLESRLPDFEQLCRDIESVHRGARSVAVHCVTLTELVFALSALERVGARRGDRIEHASVCAPEQLEQIRRLGLRVVTQPHFIAERGDQYLTDVDAVEQPWLYRLGSCLAAGIPLAAGSDAPFGNVDPWRAMHSAVTRKTASGAIMGAAEGLTPEQALALFLSPPGSPGLGSHELKTGEPADLCLLQAPWEALRRALPSDCVRATWARGERIFDSG
jgi:predicted amidohydrolase YtcJ